MPQNRKVFWEDEEFTQGGRRDEGDPRVNLSKVAEFTGIFEDYALTKGKYGEQVKLWFKDGIIEDTEAFDRGTLYIPHTTSLTGRWGLYRASVKQFAPSLDALRGKLVKVVADSSHEYGENPTTGETNIGMAHFVAEVTDLEGEKVA